MPEGYWDLKLYVAGQTPRSVAALANLKKICEEHLVGKYRVEVVDLMANPALARTDQILAIPTLVRKLPAPARKIIGDLSQTEECSWGSTSSRETKIEGTGEPPPSGTLSHARFEKTREELLLEIAELRARLAEPEETVYAIRRGEIDAFVVLEPGGEAVYTLGTAELLRQLQLITDSLPVLVAYIDRDCRYRFINRHYETWFGRPLHEFAGRPVAELLGVEAYEAVRDQIDAALAGRQVTYERWLPYRDAGEHFVHATYMPHVHAGEVQGFVSFVEDVSERKRAEEALQLLSDAGERLSESLDFETTLDNAARLAVPALADWCMIDLVQEGGDCRRVVSLHADPARQPLMEELKRYALPRDSGSRLMQVLSTGEPVFTSDLTEERVEAELRSDDHARIIRQLAPRSSLAVPLVARGRTLGVWSFLYAESGRRYREEDCGSPWSSPVAALALDNSRLYRELEAANRAKDHFLATLSHELRTPLTPVLAIARGWSVDGRLPRRRARGDRR